MKYTEDYEEATTNSGVTFYNDCDENIMEIWKDGECIAFQYIMEYAEAKGLEFEDDKCLVYDTFIEEVLR